MWRTTINTFPSMCTRHRINAIITLNAITVNTITAISVGFHNTFSYYPWRYVYKTLSILFLENVTIPVLFLQAHVSELWHRIPPHRSNIYIHTKRKRVAAGHTHVGLSGSLGLGHMGLPLNSSRTDTCSLAPWRHELCQSLSILAV